MSLCVAWRWNAEVSFASDSCIAPADGGNNYLGIKLAGIPVRIVSARDAQTGHIEERFNSTYALAFSGSYLAGYVIREMLSEVLSHLQFIAAPELMTIERVMAVVHAFHKAYTVRMRESFRFGHDLDFLIGGRCPATGAIKVFKFVASEDCDPQFAEVLIGGSFPYSAIGAGEETFRDLIEYDLAHPPCAVNFAVFRRIRDVIRDPTVPSVGGRLQTGTFEDGNFELFGVMEHDLSGDTPRALPSVRGVVIDEIYEGHNPDDFFIHYSFKAPFQADLEKLFAEGS